MRTTYVYGNEFWNFYNAQTKLVQEKIDWVVGLVRSLKIIPEKYFKHIEGTNGLYEIRVKVGSDIFRIFCFFDKGNLAILTQRISKENHQNSVKRN